MKICDLTQSYAATGGGVRTYLHAKREYLLRATDAEHVLIVPGESDGVERQGRSTVHTVASPRVPGSKVYRLLLRSDKVARLLAAERPDIIELHCAYNLPWTALHHRRSHRCSLVGVYHTDFPTAYVANPLATVFGPRIAAAAEHVAGLYARAVYRRLDATVAISTSMEARLRQLGVPRVESIPLGADTATFHPSRRDRRVRRRFGAGDDDVLIVYAGRLDGEKRVEVVVDAVERLPEEACAGLVVVGDGPLREALAARARSNPRLHLLPFETDRTALATLLASCDVYASAMPFETFGLSVLEAQACGLPVVGVRAGAMLDRVPPGTGLLGAVDSVEEMAAHIGTLAASRGLREEMGARARERVETHYSWDHTCARLISLYRRLVSEGAVS